MLCQSKGLNDPFTGGISSYGLVLMVAFALLQRDHFPPSPAGSSFVDPGFIRPPSPDPTPTEEQVVEQPETARPRTPSSQGHAIAQEELDGNDFAVPPSPGHADVLTLSLSAGTQEDPTRKKERPSTRRQRFWQCSSLTRDSLNSIGITRASKELHGTQTSGGTRSRSSWDRCGH